MDNITLQLNSPITEDQWDAITDVDFENTEEILFTTKHKKNVRFVKAQQWIPCAERLPEEFKGVLCCTDKEEMFLARVLFDDGNYSFDDEDGMMWEGNVVAWMPLPEPYKGDE